MDSSTPEALANCASLVLNTAAVLSFGEMPSYKALLSRIAAFAFGELNNFIMLSKSMNEKLLLPSTTDFACL